MGRKGRGRGMFANHEVYYPLHLHLQHLKKVPPYVEEVASITSDRAGRDHSRARSSAPPSDRAGWAP